MPEAGGGGDEGAHGDEKVTKKGTTTAADGKGLSKAAQKILRTQKQPPAPTLFLGNLGFETTEVSIRELFEAHRHWERKGKEKGNEEGGNEREQEVGEGKDKPKDVWIRKIRMGTFEDSGNCKGSVPLSSHLLTNEFLVCRRWKQVRLCRLYEHRARNRGTRQPSKSPLEWTRPCGRVRLSRCRSTWRWWPPKNKRRPECQDCAKGFLCERTVYQAAPASTQRTRGRRGYCGGNDDDDTSTAA